MSDFDESYEEEELPPYNHEDDTEHDFNDFKDISLENNFQEEMILTQQKTFF